jgi:hypothetical protein
MIAKLQILSTDKINRPMTAHGAIDLSVDEI